MAESIPEALNALRKSHEDLAKIAEHCRQINQVQGNKQQALHETKQYALQALSSVAYQVNVAAKAVNDYLSEQEGELYFQAGELSAMAQTISATQEHVSRSKLGDLPLPEPKVDGPKLVKLAEPQVAFQDRSGFKIDYRSLDNVGLGQKEFSAAPFSPSPLAMSSHSSVPSSSPSAPQPVDPVRARAPTGTGEVLSFKSRSTAPPPKPPTVPMVPQAPSTPTIPQVPTLPAAPAFQEPPPPPPPSAFSPPPPPPEADYPPPPPEDNSQPPPPPPSSRAGGFVRAVYDYVPETDEELAITAGEMLVVVTRDAGAGWMEGKNTAGKIGLFPATYVEDI